MTGDLPSGGVILCGRRWSFPGIRATDARALVTRFMHREPGGGWLPPAKTADLLRCYGIWLVDAEPAASEDEAVKPAAVVTGPVMLKAEMPGLVPEATAGAVESSLHTEAEVRIGFRWPELVTGCLTGLGRACRGYASVDLRCPGRAGAVPCVCILEIAPGRAVTDVICRWCHPAMAPSAPCLRQ